jgi:hypothetical protein
MKILCVLTSFVRLCLLGTGLFLLLGCGPETAAKNALSPSQLYANVGDSRVGGPMRLGEAKSGPRNPPPLPTIAQYSPPEPDVAEVVDPPPPPTLSSSATPMVVSPVPGEVDGYFGEAAAPTSVLGGLFNSIFIPPAPSQPSVISTATYQEVQ